MTTYDFDVALSFSGADRPVAEQLAGHLEEAGIRVFYDDNEVSDLWGKDLYQHLQSVYRDRARYCVIIVSESYGRRDWPQHELKQAQARAFVSEREYILPLRIDDSELPGINSTTGYVDLRQHSVEEVARRLVSKIRGDDYAALVFDSLDWDGSMVEHAGEEVAAFWPQKTEAAQVFRACTVTTIVPRIPYGEEHPAWNSDVPCHDCAVTKGQYHVPGCDVEQCPACGEQMLGCGCDIDYVE